MIRYIFSFLRSTTSCFQKSRIWLGILLLFAIMAIIIKSQVTNELSTRTALGANLIFNKPVSVIEKPICFNRQVKPILGGKCFACHGPDAAAREAELRLDIRNSALEVIEPGKPEKSDMLTRIASSDPEEVMPPPKTHKKITKREVELLTKWIAQGAKYEPHWSFIAVQKPNVPNANSTNWGYNEIDRYVLRRLKLEGLKPSAEAKRHTLIRRVTLDLTELPPTPKQVDAFVNDPAITHKAFEKVVDRLLKSSEYGEHIAYRWLDAARYADSDGYESDPLRSMWPWRDWVIDSLNKNMPYDQFIAEQLAGDLLEQSTLRQRLATAFNRNHRLNNEGGILPAEWIVEYICDRAETTATVFMGLTWGCARCHDHKFDPIS